MGSRYILKDRGDTPPNFDPQNLPFLRIATTIPVPMILDEWREPDGAHMTILRRIEGETLKEAWPSLSDHEKQRIARQTADYIGQLRNLQSDRLQCLDGSPLYSAYLFANGFGNPHGPFSSDDELWNGMAQALQRLSDDERQRLRQRMPAAKPYTFTHGDLNISNIMIKDGNVTGILDWEASGYFPVWWEFVATSIIDGPEDREWKHLLRGCMQNQTEAEAFWKEFLSLSRSPR